MNIDSDGAEIDEANDMQVYGDWVKFVDGEGSVIKIPPDVILKLMVFCLNNHSKFDDTAWD